MYIITIIKITTMSENFGYIDIILLAMLAGFIFLRLRNVLGKGADNAPIKHDFLKKAQENFSFVQDVQEKSKEPSFDEAVFKKGAEYAYEMIINAFASGDKATLKSLLNKKLYEDFSLIIDERNEKKLKSELTFIGIKKLSIDKIANEGTKYKVTARFVSEIITCLKNEKGEVIEGDPEKTKVTTDVWSFERDLKDKDQKLHPVTHHSSPNNFDLRVDLHGYTIDEAFQKIDQLMSFAEEKKIKKILIITGKGLHSNKEQDPYASKDLSLLKYAVPDYLQKLQQKFCFFHHLLDLS